MCFWLTSRGNTTPEDQRLIHRTHLEERKNPRKYPGITNHTQTKGAPAKAVWGGCEEVVEAPPSHRPSGRSQTQLRAAVFYRLASQATASDHKETQSRQAEQM